MRAATAYQRGTSIFIHSSSKTTAGIWILSTPVYLLQHAASEEIGKSVQEAVSASQEGVPHPKSWTGIFDPILQLAQLKSWPAFVKSSKCVELEEIDGVISLIPTRNLGADEGFEPMPTRASRSGPMDVELGEALLAAFKDSE